MKGTNTNEAIIEGYLQLLDNLSAANKLDLISRLTQSVKSDISDKKVSFKRAFGALKSKKSAEVIIEEIRGSRNFNRKLESL